MRIATLLLCTLLSTTFSLADEPHGISDSAATPETRALFANLTKIAHGPTMLFGQQGANLYGVGWSGDADRSDIHTAVGAYPAVFGYDLNVLLSNKKETGFNPVYHQRIQDAYALGGMITVSWHMRNPVNGKSFYDLTPAVGQILPGKKFHDDYRKTLDRVAAYFGSLKGPKGEPIPIVFRPFHEHTGSWFWWGEDLCTTEEYVALWRFTIDYLREGHGLHNLLVAYSPSFNASARVDGDIGQHMMQRYPGDQYVDVIGLDSYHSKPEQIKEVATVGLPIIVREAEKRGKIAAYTEGGVSKGLSKAWNHTYFTDLATAIQSDPVGRRIAYLAPWQNRSPKSYWTPCQPDDPHLPDFKAFYADPFTVFLDSLPKLYE